MQVVNEYVDMIKELKEKNPQLQLIVLPETAITFPILQSSYYEKYMKFKNFVDSTNVPVLVGFPYYHVYKDSLSAPVDAKQSGSGKYYDTFNAAALFEKNKNQEEFQIYKKNCSKKLSSIQILMLISVQLLFSLKRKKIIPLPQNY